MRGLSLVVLIGGHRGGVCAGARRRQYMKRSGEKLPSSILDARGGGSVAGVRVW